MSVGGVEGENTAINILMSSHSETVIHNVATYLYYAFRLRQELLEST